jgi:hypothetical protein
MKKNAIKFVLLALASGIIFGGSAITSFASDDNILFNLTIPANQSYVRTNYRYRETTNTLNNWKVNVTASNEGAGSYYYFVLVDSNWKIVSPVNVGRTSFGPRYLNAYASASKTNVALAAQNTEKTSKTWGIAGYWDEETN